VPLDIGIGGAGAETELDDLDLFEPDDWATEAAEARVTRSSTRAAVAETNDPAPGDMEAGMEAGAHDTPPASPTAPVPPARDIEPVKALTSTDTARPAATRRRYGLLAGLAVLALSAVGAIMVLSPSSPNHDAALGSLPDPETASAPTAPTTLATTTTRAATTVTSTIRPPEPTASEPTATEPVAAAPPTTALPRTQSPITAGRAHPVESVAMPQLIGRDADEAAAELARLGLAHRVQEVSTRQPSMLDKVVDQEPKAETQVPRGATVTLAVATRLEILDLDLLDLLLAVRTAN
jgi:hypothetical protein